MMSKPLKIVLGIVSVLPVAWICVAFFGMATFASMAFAGAHHYSGRGGRPIFDSFLPFFFAVHLLAMLLVLALIAFYIVFLFRTPRVAEEKKVLWAVVLFIGNIGAFPIFWYLYIWKDPSDEAAVESSPSEKRGGGDSGEVPPA